MSKKAKDILQKKEKFLKIAKAAFDNVDTDRSGEIDSDELGKIMSQISKQMGTMPPSREDIKEIFDNIDTDHSGEIDFDEFQVLIKNVLTSMMLDEEDDSDDE